MIDATMKRLTWQSASMFLVLGTALIVAAVIAAASALSPAQVADRTATGQPRTGALAERFIPAPSPAVGVLFTRQGGVLGRHFCTASVVASPSGDLLITAAHCVTGLDLSPAGRLVFAPGYSDGRFPHGLWAVVRKFVDAAWATRQDPDNDVAFLQVRPLYWRHASRSSLQNLTGAERLGFDVPLPAQIDAIGYPDGSNQAVSCPTRATSFRPGALNQVMFVCPGFTDGTSGGPFLSGFSRVSGVGTIIGVIGGYQQGGDSPSISYSSAFTASIRSLYDYVLKTG